MRIGKVEYYLNIARAVAMRGTCLRRNYGAVIVKDDAIVSTGYTGAPRNMPNCCDTGKCIRRDRNIPSGQNYELCESVHAEMNAIIHASREEMIGADMYITGIDMKSGNMIEGLTMPCKLCKRMIVNSGVRNVYVTNASPGEDLSDPVKWKITNMQRTMEV